MTVHDLMMKLLDYPLDTEVCFVNQPADEYSSPQVEDVVKVFHPGMEKGYFIELRGKA